MSITKKLFVITAVVFIIFISTAFIIQSLFFESFYISKKRSDLISSIERFKTDYNKTDNDEKVAQLLEEYEAESNIKIAIMDSNGNIKFVSKPLRDRTGALRIRELTDFVREWENPDNISNAKYGNKTLTILPREDKGTERKLISITPNNNRNEIIFAISSLQPVSEAASVINQVYLYLYIGAVFIVVILSSVYSNMIAKPLLKINKVATKMANLDFSQKCAVVSQDEIGNVASSLNFLSENLDNALNSLREANSQLEADIEKERNLEKMRKEFIAAVSHELKTPISLIDGYAVGLKDDIFEGEDKDYYLDVIIDESRKMGHLVSDMLDLSQLESGNFKLTLEEFDLKELINFVMRKYNILTNEKSAKIQMNLLDDVKVNADWGRMEQVITNFITNALRHVDEKGTVSVRMIDKDDSISVEIENTGSGIPEEELTKIWDKFYKIDKSRNRKLGGTGIGLSIVKNILMLHGYTFGVANTDKGVKFYFEVPKMPGEVKID